MLLIPHGGTGVMMRHPSVHIVAENDLSWRGAID